MCFRLVVVVACRVGIVARDLAQATGADSRRLQAVIWPVFLVVGVVLRSGCCVRAVLANCVCLVSQLVRVCCSYNCNGVRCSDSFGLSRAYLSGRTVQLSDFAALSNANTTTTASTDFVALVRSGDVRIASVAAIFLVIVVLGCVFDIVAQVCVGFVVGVPGLICGLLCAMGRGRDWKGRVEVIATASAAVTGTCVLVCCFSSSVCSGACFSLAVGMYALFFHQTPAALPLIVGHNDNLKFGYSFGLMVVASSFAIIASVCFSCFAVQPPPVENRV